MNQRIVARGLPGGVLSLALALLLMASVGPSVAAGQFAPGVVVTEEPRVTETPPLTETPAETAVPDTTQGGGVVPSPTEIEHDGVAPGQVDLVIVTSDGGMLPAGTTACVGDVCQTLSSDAASGFKWRFERMKEGWQEITVRGAASYDGAVSSVRVAPGRLVTANVEIVRISPRNEGVGNTPPPAQDGPNNPPVREGTDSSGSSQSNPDGTQRFAQVTDLPEAGAGTAHQSLMLIGLVTLASGMFALAAIVRRRTTGGSR